MGRYPAEPMPRGAPFGRFREANRATRADGSIAGLVAFSSVVVEVLRSREGEQALRHAVELAGTEGRVTVVGVAVTSRPEGCCGAERATRAIWNRLMRERAAEDCEYAAALLGSGAVERRVFEGRSRASALSAAAGELAADVLVVPSARGPLGQLALRGLRRRVGCPVLEGPPRSDDGPSRRPRHAAQPRPAA
jgi:nucleotide-binding universal stress UspA family protein